MAVNKLTLPAKENAVQSKINEIIDNFPSGTTVDQTYDGTSANAQSGVAINGELTSNYQTKLVSGTNIKTINNTSLLGSGDIDTSEVFVAEYDVTSYADVLAAYNAGKTIYVKYTGERILEEPMGYYSFVEYENLTPPESFIFSRTHGTLIENVIVSYSLSNQGSTIWNMTSTTTADNTLSNVSSIDSNSAVQTALDGKVSKSGDTMTGHLAISEDAIAKIELTNTSFDPTSTTAPASNVYAGAIDIFGSDNYHVGYFRTRHSSANYFQSQMGVRRSINNTDYEANIIVTVNPDGTSSCTFPNTTCVDGQWVKYSANVASSVSLIGTTDLTYTLGVPNDGYNYEALLYCELDSGSTSGNYAKMNIYSDVISEVTLCRVRTRTNSPMNSSGTAIIPLTTSRKIYVQRASNWNGTFSLYIRAYRRIGTNT